MKCNFIQSNITDQKYFFSFRCWAMQRDWGSQITRVQDRMHQLEKREQRQIMPNLATIPNTYSNVKWSISLLIPKSRPVPSSYMRYIDVMSKHLKSLTKMNIFCWNVIVGCSHVYFVSLLSSVYVCVRQQDPLHLSGLVTLLMGGKKSTSLLKTIVYRDTTTVYRLLLVSYL